MTNKQSFEENKTYWYNDIKKINNNIPIYLIGNKIKLKNEIKVTENEVKKFTSLEHIKYFSVSVKKNIGIKNIIKDLLSNIGNNIKEKNI